MSTVSKQYRSDEQAHSIQYTGISEEFLLIKEDLPFKAAEGATKAG